jgi:hypothetical protein
MARMIEKTDRNENAARGGDSGERASKIVDP